MYYARDNNIPYFAVMAFLLFTFCGNLNRKNVSVYDENFYKKVDIVGPNGDDVQLRNEEIFVFLPDTNRKMLKYYWDNGKMQAKFFLYKGKKDGKWVGYFDNEVLSFEGNFLNNEKNGEFRIYDPNGKISIIETYKMGVKDGIWYYYDTLGTVIKTENYKKK